MGAVWLAGCAEGAAIPDFQTEQLPNSMQSPDAGSTTDPLAMPDAGGQPMQPAFTGEQCVMGDEVPCTCDDGGEGVKICMANPASPSGGELSPCGNCMPVMMDAPDAGAGTAGGGSTPPPPPGTMQPGRTCDVNACPTPASPIPLLPAPQKCCTDQGTCGEQDLFGNCI